jgi:hypothetical protein
MKTKETKVYTVDFVNKKLLHIECIKTLIAEQLWIRTVERKTK